jgi:voltage-gated potassium channel
MPPSARPEPDHQLERERWEALGQVVTLLEGPMTLLGFVWLGIVVAELAGTAGRLLTLVGTLIWILFLLDFLAELLVAPRRGQYLRQHWLAAVSLAVPALRILRFVSLLRVARAARIVSASRGLRLLRLVTSFNRGMQALRRSMARRGFSYVVALTVIVVLAGAGGMLAFEGRTGANPQGFRSYGEALWWTAMIITTMGNCISASAPSDALRSFAAGVASWVRAE